MRMQANSVTALLNDVVEATAANTGIGKNGRIHVTGS
jgi:hypothetical protein